MTQRRSDNPMDRFWVGLVLATTMGLSMVSFVTAFHNGTEWRRDYDKLETRVQVLEKENAEWRALGKSPAVLGEALNRYDKIHEQLLILEQGWPVKTSPRTVKQCFTVSVPRNPMWLAGM